MLADPWPVLIAALIVAAMFALAIGLTWFLATHLDVLAMLVGIAAAVCFCVARANWAVRD
jgi:hypothetical protein